MSSEQRYKHRFWGLAILLLVAVGWGGISWQRGAVGQDAEKHISPKAKAHANELSTAFRKAAEVAMPSTVTIRSKTKAQPAHRTSGKRGSGENPFKGTPFEDFFKGENGGDMAERFGTPTPRREGMGSGVIIDPSGIILTNNHVVQGADEVIVHLADGREYKADDIKTDEQTDLAVIRIKGAGDLPAATLGDSDGMEIGDWVIAVGNPFELEQTVSAGIISGKGRELGSIRRAKFLQTDAAINPGNSGGPLVDLNGEVIGINTAIATNNGSFQGIGFAIPSNTVKWVMTQLIKKGSVERAYLGVQIGEVTKELAAKFGVKKGEGVLVSEVMPNTPASKAGFKDGDVIISFSDHKVHNPRELQELVERVPIDSKATVEVQRDGKAVPLTVVVKALPKQLAASDRTVEAEDPADEASDGYANDKLGMTVTEMAKGDAKQLGLEGHSGVLISKVDPEGLAAEQGLREGMLITKVGKKEVKTTADFEAAVKHESLAEGILLQVRTKQGNRFVVLQQS